MISEDISINLSINPVLLKIKIPLQKLFTMVFIKSIFEKLLIRCKSKINLFCIELILKKLQNVHYEPA
jgi:hypothetical protein